MKQSTHSTDSDPALFPSYHPHLSLFDILLFGDQGRQKRNNGRDSRSTLKMSMLDKFKRGAEKAGIQATAFMNRTGSKVASETKGFAQNFSLPGECERSAKILASFLGVCVHVYVQRCA